MSQPFRHSDEASFVVQVRLHRSATPADEVEFQRRTEDWLALHDLRADGAQTSFAVLAGRELSAIDQANTLLALLDDPAVRHARVGPLVAHADSPAASVSGRLWVEVDRHDMLLDAARVLYEAGRLDGEGFLEALGSYVWRPLEDDQQAAEDLA
jgi:hypothetical protein